MKNTFDPQVTKEVIGRINNLTKDTQPKWGKMSVGQMLAHLCISYEMVYTDKHSRPNGFMRFLLKAFLKNTIVGEKPYKKNSRTAPAFMITDQRDFDTEKTRLIAFVEKTEKLGASHFEQKESNSLGKLTSKEWSNMFYKHADHHLRQFGV